jgi:peptidoglycan hydrolase CwlO-like protein
VHQSAAIIMNMGLVRSKMMRSVIGAVMVSVALSACETRPPAKVEHKSDPDISGKVQSLQKQIHERDKHIEEQDKRIQELESQIEALKLIDQDHENQRKPVRPPTTVGPTP